MKTLAAPTRLRAIGPQGLIVHSVYPENESHTPPILFIPGAAHNHYCWGGWQEQLARLGIESHALSLRGHTPSCGRVRTARLEEYIADIRAAVEALGLKRFILAGHSYGGVVAQCYARRAPVHALALLASWSPQRVNRACLRASREVGRRHPLTIARTLVNFESFFNTPVSAREVLLGPEAEPAQVDWLLKTALCKETRYLLLDMLRLERQGWQPIQTECVFILRGQADVLCTAADAEALAADYGTAAITLPELPHDLMIIQPEVGLNALYQFVLTC
jgi:pimeloyl-ACP methyl ester carboxylesterase